MIISGESHLLLASVSSLVPWLYVLCRHNIAWPFLPASLQLLHCAFWLDDHCCHHTKEKATPQSGPSNRAHSRKTARNIAMSFINIQSTVLLQNFFQFFSGLVFQLPFSSRRYRIATLSSQYLTIVVIILYAEYVAAEAA